MLCDEQQRPRTRIVTTFCQNVAFRDSVIVIHLQDTNSGFPHFGNRFDDGPIQMKMIWPSVIPWMIEPHQLCSSRYYRPNIGTFGRVAEDAGKRQIINVG